MNLGIAIVGLLFLILIHEAGHFFVALAVGMRPRKFYVGFPPAIAKKMHNGIEYGIGAIPLGGYVRIPGMHRPAARDAKLNFGTAVAEAPELQDVLEPLEQQLEESDFAAARTALGAVVAAVDAAELSRGARRSANRGLRDLEESLGDDAYWRQPTWKRIAVIFAGPGVNIVFAIALLALVYSIGAPDLSSATRKVDTVSAQTPAARAGLHAGDVIVAVNGVRTPTFDAIHRRVTTSNGAPLALTVRRDGRAVTLPAVRPDAVKTIVNGKPATVWRLGFAAAPLLRRYPVGTAFTKALGDCWSTVTGTVKAIGGLFHKQERRQVTSVYGITKASAQALSVSFRLYLELLAFISLGLAVLNLLPLLPLDGGHILFSAIEGIRRRAVAREVYERASVIGFALLMLVFLIALNNDVGRHGPG